MIFAHGGFTFLTLVVSLLIYAMIILVFLPAYGAVALWLVCKGFNAIAARACAGQTLPVPGWRNAVRMSYAGWAVFWATLYGITFLLLSDTARVLTAVPIALFVISLLFSFVLPTSFRRAAILAACWAVANAIVVFSLHSVGL